MSKKIQTDAIISPDIRGKSTGRRTYSINDETIQTNVDHINQFPVIESHYVRKTTSRKYLEKGLNVTKMFELYTSWLQTETVSGRRTYKTPATLRQ